MSSESGIPQGLFVIRWHDRQNDGFVESDKVKELGELSGIGLCMLTL